MGSLENIDEAAKSILKSSDKKDILVNNAGIIQNLIISNDKRFRFKEIFEINFFQVTNFTQKIIKGW